MKILLFVVILQPCSRRCITK